MNYEDVGICKDMSNSYVGFTYCADLRREEG